MIMRVKWSIPRWEEKVENANVATVDGDADDDEEEVKTSHPKM